MITNIKDTAKKWLAGVLVLLIAILITVLIIKIYRAVKKPANAKYIEGGGSIPADFDAGQWSDALFDVIHLGALTSDKDDMFGQFNALNDNKKIAIYNDWNDRYSDFKTMWLFPMGTLTQAVKDEFPYGIVGANQRDIMIANLDRLKLP